MPRGLILHGSPEARAKNFELAFGLAEKKLGAMRLLDVEVKELYVRDIVYLVHVPTEKMIADIFTKAVDKDIFLRCRDYMLNVVNQPGLQHAFLAGALRRLSGL